MYVIYTPEVRLFLQCVIPLSDTVWLEWDSVIHDEGILSTIEDAITMAKEVQKIRVAEQIFHYSVQVLRIGEDKWPDMRIPVYEISSPKRVSMN